MFTQISWGKELPMNCLFFFFVFVFKIALIAYSLGFEKHPKTSSRLFSLRKFHPTSVQQGPMVDWNHQSHQISSHLGCWWKIHPATRIFPSQDSFGWKEGASSASLTAAWIPGGWRVRWFDRPVGVQRGCGSQKKLGRKWLESIFLPLPCCFFSVFFLFISAFRFFVGWTNIILKICKGFGIWKFRDGTWSDAAIVQKT